MSPTKGEWYIQSTLIILKSKGLSEILFEIFLPRPIRFSELRKKLVEQPHFTNEYVDSTLKLEIY